MVALRDAFFAAKPQSEDEVWTMASELLEVPKATAAACANQEDVTQRLKDDIELAGRYDIQGTPLVLLNGVRLLVHPRVLAALILANGNPDHPALE